MTRDVAGPRTEAGRAVSHLAAIDYPIYDKDILAIEAEAAAAVRADLIERLEREPHHWECFREGERGDRRYKCNCWHQTVLALLRDDTEPSAGVTSCRCGGPDMLTARHSPRCPSAGVTSEAARTDPEFLERPCPACGAALAPSDTHWSLMAGPAGGYVCPSTSTETPAPAEGETSNG